jgi:hypothetical protein
MTQVQDRVRAYVVFLHPDGWDRESVEASLWDEAVLVPGVQVVDDRNGVETRRFGAFTSGQTYLYDEKGTLVFQGGITSARGHVGENAGRTAITSFLMSRAAETDRASTYGCPLFSRKAE